MKSPKPPKKSPLSTILSELRLISQKQSLQYLDIMNELRKMRESRGDIIVNEDKLYPEVKKLAEEMGNMSVSLIQRKFKIGYSRARQMLDILIEKGIIDERDLPEPEDEIEEE